MRELFATKVATGDIPTEVEKPTVNNEKALEAGVTPAPDASSHSDRESLSSDAQDGVKDIEVITSVWSKSHLIIAYILYVFCSLRD